MTTTTQQVQLSEYDAEHAKPWIDRLGYVAEYGDPVKPAPARKGA